MEKEKNLPKLPNGWIWINLGEVHEIISGIGFPKKYQGLVEGEIPFYKVMDISKTVLNGGKYISESDNYVSKEVAELLNVNFIKANSIIFAKIGEAIKLNRRVIVKKDCLIDNNIMSIRSFTNNLFHLYSFYYLNTVKLTNYARATTVPSIRKSDVELIPFPLSPLPEQQRIVNKIEELFTLLDAGLEALQKIKSQLKVYRQAVLKHAFEGKLTEEWRENNGYENVCSSKLRNLNKEENKKAQDFSTFSELPHSWGWSTINNISEVVSGQHILKGDYNYEIDGIPYLTGPIDFGVKNPKVSKWTKNPKAKAKNNDILITVKGAGVGKCNILDIEEAAISRQLMAIRADSNSTISEYIFYYLISKFYFLQKIGAGSTVPGIDRESIKSFSLPLPPLLEQEKVVEEIERCFSIADRIEEIVDQNLQKAEKLRQGILKKAFEGKLVPQDPNDEPAYKLLERIKAEKEKNEAEKKTNKQKKSSKKT